MRRVVMLRLLRLLLTLWVVSFLTFFMVSAFPGDPVLVALGGNVASVEQYEEVKEELGLNESVPVRYVTWLGNALQGDLGKSYLKDEQVSTLMLQRIPVTLELALVAMALAIIVSIPLGVLSAYRVGRPTDVGITGMTILLLSTPSFIIGTALSYIVGVRLGWLPVASWTRLTEDLVGNLRSVALPAISLALVEIGIYVRVLRTDMITTLQNDFVEVARAKGLSDRRGLFRRGAQFRQHTHQ
ncbi:MAG: ABC transporter permease, partial [Acidimicrobiales bacterium]